MNRWIWTLVFGVGISSPFTGGRSAIGQSPSIAGTWVLTAADKLLPDGTRVADYGPNPHGLVIFTRDGYYSLQIYRSDRLKFSSGDKFNGTVEEYRDASLSMSTSFGRYSVDQIKHTITFQVDRSSVPNRDDTGVRPYELKGDELSWKVAARKDGSIPITVLRRVSAEEHPKFNCPATVEERSKEGTTHPPDL